MSANWLPIKGYEGQYAISDGGQVLSMTWGNTNLPKLLKFGMSRGYCSVYLYDQNHVGRRFTVHRLVLAAFVSERPRGMQINHKNGVKSDNRLENLEYCTPSQNSKHAHAMGLQSNEGERHSRSKLTDEKVLQIKVRIAEGMPIGEIAKEFGVHSTNVSHIKSGRIWAHLTREGG